ncbi:MAG TPA: TatD family hydrolase [Tepidisphaeraceae bacterium]|nr:TatD family hydrolase [Tepidisphaeraceae bacterium]
MIDTHCHLTDTELAGQLDDVMDRCAAAGVRQVITIGTTPADWKECLAVCDRFSNVRCAVGVHPTYCNEAELPQLQELRSLSSDPRVVALGEMGLDHHYDNVPRQRQRDFFTAQLAIAVENKKSVVIHSRQAIDECLAVLRDYPVPAAVFHCFTGTTAEAERVIAAGHYLGFTGVVTFKKTGELRQIAAMAPEDRIVVETDAPWLSPEPKRGQKVNEPALVMHTAAVVAAARGIRLDELDRITSDNAMRLYGMR